VFGLVVSMLVIAPIAIVLHDRTATLEPSSQSASFTGVVPQRPASHDPAVSRPAVDRTTAQHFDVRRGVSLTPVHPAFYALSARMERLGYVLRHTDKGRSASFTVSSLNVLGAGHTEGPGARAGYASGVARMHGAVGLLVSHDVSVAGLQEFEEPQFHTFEALVGGTYDVWPGLTLGPQPVQNSIIWKKADWSLVEAHTMSVPYFHGHRVPMPYVKLRNLHTGQEVWFYNSHNPADAYGPAGHWRAVATAEEEHLARTLTADGTPMIVTGDMNDRAPFACPFAAGTGMHSADGVVYTGGCHLPRHTNVDWIFGSQSLTFSGFITDRSSQTRRITDHPMVRAVVEVPAQADPRCHPAFGFGWFCPRH
jgi:hypothetical protein